MTQADTAQSPWIQRPETLAGASGLFSLAAAVALITGAYIPGALCAALAVTAATLAALSARIERAHLLARAQAAESAKARFLAAANHDMRQPLHAITLYLSALGKRVEGEEARDILSKTSRAADSLSAMFGGLTQIAQLESGAAPDPESFAIQPLLDELIAAQTGAVVQNAPSTAHVRTDRALLGLALTHLIANAMLHGAGAAQIEIDESAGEVEIVIADSGPGIPLADQARIFDDFVRLDGARRGEGLGLGLGAVKRISDLLGVRLALKSAAGEGARFSLHLPRAS